MWIELLNSIGTKADDSVQFAGIAGAFEAIRFVPAFPLLAAKLTLRHIFRFCRSHYGIAVDLIRPSELSRSSHNEYGQPVMSKLKLEKSPPWHFRMASMTIVVITYAISFFLPAYRYISNEYSGLEAFGDAFDGFTATCERGLMEGMIGAGVWMANPLFWLAIAFLAMGWRLASLTFAAFSLALVVKFGFDWSSQVTLLSGFYVWASSFAALLIAVIGEPAFRTIRGTTGIPLRSERTT